MLGGVRGWQQTSDKAADETCNPINTRFIMCVCLDGRARGYYLIANGIHSLLEMVNFDICA